MLREHRRKSRRQSRSEDAPAAEQIAQTQLDRGLLRRSRSQIILIPPIRSLSTRDLIHHSSKVTLVIGTDGSGPDDSHPDLDSDPSKTIPRAIAQLEKTLEEACRLVQSVGGVGHRSPTPPPVPEPERRRPSASIAYKSLKYLEQANKHGLSPCGPAHGEQQPLKSRPATAQITRPSEDVDLYPSTRPRTSARRCKSDSDIRLPQAGHHSRYSRNRLKVRIAEPDGCPSKADIKAYIRSHAKPPITARVSSQIHTPSRDRSTFLQVPPVLKLNDEDLPNKRDKHGIGHQSSFSRVFGISSRHGSVDLSQPHSNDPKIDLRRVCYVDILNRPGQFRCF